MLLTQSRPEFLFSPSAKVCCLTLFVVCLDNLRYKSVVSGITSDFIFGVSIFGGVIGAGGVGDARIYITFTVETLVRCGKTDSFVSPRMFGSFDVLFCIPSPRCAP